MAAETPVPQQEAARSSVRPDAARPGVDSARNQAAARGIRGLVGRGAEGFKGLFRGEGGNAWGAKGVKVEGPQASGADNTRAGMVDEVRTPAAGAERPATSGAAEPPRPAEGTDQAGVSTETPPGIRPTAPGSTEEPRPGEQNTTGAAESGVRPAAAAGTEASDGAARPDTTVDPAAEQAQAARRAGAYNELRNLNIDISGSTNVDDVMAKLHADNNWQMDDATREYVQAAVDHARAQEAGSQSAAGEAVITDPDAQPATDGAETAAAGAQEPAVNNNGQQEGAQNDQTQEGETSVEAPLTPEQQQIKELKEQIDSLKSSLAATNKAMETVVDQLNKGKKIDWKSILELAGLSMLEGGIMVTQAQAVQMKGAGGR